MPTSARHDMRDDGNTAASHAPARGRDGTTSPGRPAPDPGDIVGFVTGLPETVVRYDTQGRITYVNDHFCERTRRTRSEVLGSRPFQWADEQHLVPDVAEYRRMLAEAIDTGDVRQLTRTRDLDGGGAEIFQVRFQPELDDDGDVVGVWALARNESDLFHARLEIAEREREFRTLAENLPDVVIRYDALARVTYINRTVDMAGGPTIADLVGRTPTEAQPGDPSVAGYEACLRAVIATGEAATFEKWHTNESGEARVHSILIRAERCDVGDIVGAIAIGRDVTDLVAAHREIAERELRFRTLAENMPEVLVRYDAEGRAVYANRQFAERLGGESVIGKMPEDIPSRSRPYGAYREQLRQVLATGEPAQIELSPDGPDGAPRYQSVLIQPEFDADGNVTGAISIGRDVTDLVHARQEAAEREREFRTLAENLPQVLVRYDRDGVVAYVNRQYALQVSTEPVLGQPLRNTGRPGITGVGYRDLLDRVFATGEPGEVEVPVISPSGDRRIHLVQLHPEFDDGGNVISVIGLGHDVTEVVHARRALEASELRFRSLAENVPDIILQYDLEGRTTYVNRRIDEQVNVATGDVIGRRPSEVSPPGMLGVDEYEAALLHVLATGEPMTSELSLLDDRGDRRIHSVEFRAERDASDAIVGALAIGRDVTEILRTKQEVAERERQFRTLAENAVDCIARWDSEARRIYVNPTLARLLGEPSQTLLGARSQGGPTGAYRGLSDAVHALIADPTPRTVQQRFIHPDDGEVHIHEVRLVPEYDEQGTFISVLGIGRDVTEVLGQREALLRAARTDALTGVSSRPVLYERLPEMIEARAGSTQQLALLLLDLDGFKHINDQYGHRLGDRILREVGAALNECTRGDDLLVRLGGDEFVIVLDGFESPTDASLLAHQARMRLAELDGDDEMRYPAIDASVGIAVFPGDGDDVDMLLAHADLALYEAKRGGRGRVEFYRPELRAAMERRAVIEQALRDCVPDTEMALHLQPICSLESDPHVWGAEALLRWNHPVFGPIAPDEFIPIAEQSGQIVPIGRWVLRRAAEIATELNTGRSRPLRIAVNVSTRQFVLDDIADAVRDALTAAECDPRSIVLEITENLLLEDLPLVDRALDALRSIGVGIAIDDFGTGYSALQYLTRLHIDHMKVDKAFLRDADVDHQQQEIVRALVALAHALDIGIVAEGIETPGQARLLQQLGCRLGQGYLLAKPMPVDQFECWLATSATSLREALPA